MKKKLKILFLQNRLPHYRVDLYESLHSLDNLEIAVAYSYGEQAAGASFRQIVLPAAPGGSFVRHEGLYKLCCSFDVVIAMFDIRWLTFGKLSLMRSRPFRLIYWGIGVSTEKGYDAGFLFDPVRYLWAHLSDAVVFYSEYPVRKYRRALVSSRKMFVAPNTVRTVLSGDYMQKRADSVRNRFVFIGSLSGRKHIHRLITSFARLHKKFPFIGLDIVGQGAGLPGIEAQLEEEGIRHACRIHGQINDDARLSAIFQHALACVSPGQAGLSVLKSFSFATPFIAGSGAMTGGELFAIKDGTNGFIYPGINSTLDDCMTRLIESPSLADQLSLNAFHTYWRQRTMEHIRDGFMAAITFVTSESPEP